MAYIDELLAQRRDPIGQSLIPSLKQQKEASVAQKVADKTAAIDPQKLVNDDLLSNYNKSIRQDVGRSSSLLDFAQSSGFSALGNLGDAAKSTSNSLFGSNFDNSRESGWSNIENADRAAGLSQEARGQYNQDVQALYGNIAEGNVWDSVKGSLALGPRVLADSAATIPEAVAGSLLTASGIAAPAGLALLGNKGRKALKAVNTVKEGINKAQEKSKAAKLIANSLKSASNTSIMTADLVQQQVHDYKEQNNGESPSGGRVAAMLLGNTAANMLELGVIKNLFLPFKGKVKPSLNKFKKEAKNLLDYADEGTAQSLIKTVTGGVPKVLAAGGAEGAQEYIQTWVEILGVKMDPKEAGGFMASAYKEITDEGNRNEAVLGMMLGASAGGTAKAALGAPGVAVKTAADITKGGTKFAGRVAQDIGDKAALSVMSEEDIKNIKTDYESRKAATKQYTEELTTKIKDVEAATDIAQLKADPEILPFVAKYQEDSGITDEQIASDPKIFKSVQNEIVKQHKKDRIRAATEFRTSSLSNVAGMVKSNVTDKVKAGVKQASETIKKSDSDTVIGTVKGLSSSAVKAVKEIKSSTALGIIEMSADAAGSQVKNAVKAAKDIELSDLKRTVEVVREKNPSFANALDKVASEMVTAKGRLGQYKSDVINSDTMPKAISEVVASGKVTAEQAAATVVNLTNAATSKIADISSLETVKKALEVYESSDIAHNSEAVQRIKKRLDVAATRINNESASAFKKVKAVVNSLETQPIAEQFKDSVIGEKLKDLYSSDTVQSAVSKTKGLLEDLKSVDISESSTRLKESLNKIIQVNTQYSADSGTNTDTVQPSEIDVFTSDIDVRQDSGPSSTAAETVTVPTSETSANVDKAKSETDTKTANADKVAIVAVSKMAKDAYVKADGKEASIAAFEDIVKRLKSHIPDTVHSVAQLMEEVSGPLSEEQKAVVAKYYPSEKVDTDVDTPVQFNEQYDNVDTKPMSDQEVKDQYLKDFPGCTLK